MARMTNAQLVDEGIKLRHNLDLLSTENRELKDTICRRDAEIERLRALIPKHDGNKCTRCDGTGEKYNGVCFTCNGTGTYPGKYEARLRFAAHNRDKVRPLVAKHYGIPDNEVTVRHVRAWCARD